MPQHYNLILVYGVRFYVLGVLDFHLIFPYERTGAEPAVPLPLLMISVGLPAGNISHVDLCVAVKVPVLWHLFPPVF